MVNLKEKYKDLISEAKSAAPFSVNTAFVLGSGLGDFAETVTKIKTIPTTELTGYPVSTVEGHKGFIHFCEYHNKRFILFQGRIHLYEGYDLSQSLIPVLLAKELGVENILLSNAAGGVADNLHPGDLMLISAFNTINIKKEMATVFGVASAEEKENIRFNFPSKFIHEKLIEAALEEKVYLKEGIYWYNKGPSYETPAEIQMVKNFGVAAVGMSTAHEALYAAKLGMKVGAFSLITNYAAGISPVKLSHQEVIETAEAVKPKLEKLIKRFIELTI